MYKSTIVESSSEVTKIEAVALKNLADVEGIEVEVNASPEGYIVLNPEKYVVLHVENDKSKDNKEYDVLVIIDASGKKYKTGSESFMRSFFDIYNELEGESGWSLKVFGKESKNYKGKKFLTCSVVYSE